MAKKTALMAKPKKTTITTSTKKVVKSKKMIQPSRKADSVRTTPQASSKSKTSLTKAAQSSSKETTTKSLSLAAALSKSSTSKKKMPSFTEIMNTKTLTVLGIILLIALVYSLRGFFLGAIVNGQPITRFKIMKEAEQAQGVQILDGLVMETLIVQKAREQGVQISDAAIMAKIDEYRKNFAESGQDFDQLLEMQGLTMDKIKNQVKIQMLVEALISTDIEVTDEQVNQYLEENKEFLPEDMSEEELRELVVDQLKQQELSARFQDWTQKLRDQAKIEYFGHFVQEPTPAAEQ